MSIVVTDWRGIIIELDDAETNQLLNTINPAAGAGGTAATTAALVALGVSAAAAGVVGAALALHLAWEIPAIRSMNQGNGVILTAPWAAPGVVIPATRYPSDINQNWASMDNGTFTSSGNDQVDWLIERGVDDPAAVAFQMVNQTQSGWDKSFILRDGEGSEWEIVSTPARMGRESLWAH